MNFFQMPNFLWDMDLDIYERAVLTHIVRKTIGWGKTTDGISYSQFQKALGIGKRKIIETIKKLEEKEIIQVTRQKNEKGHSVNLYKIHDEIIKKANSDLVSEGNKGCIREEQGVVSERNKQNTSITKNTITKEKETSEEKLTLLDLVDSFLKELSSKSNINLLRLKNKYERVFYELKKYYPLEEIQEVINYALKEEKYLPTLTNPSFLSNSFENIKVVKDKTLQEEERWY
jgi:DNA-binding Lrp family transcriptional regulator